MRTIGIYGGSFNPIHVGHIALARSLVARGLVDEVWLMVSPCNPLKAQSGLAPDHWRLRLAQAAVSDVEGVCASDFEFALPRPSYTYATLKALERAHPDCRFALLIGADNWQVFDRWAHHDRLLSEHDIFIYPRPDCPINAASLPSRVHLLADVPQFDVSATNLRRRIAAGQDVSPWMPPAAHRLLIADNPYRKEG